MMILFLILAKSIFFRILENKLHGAWKPGSHIATLFPYPHCCPLQQDSITHCQHRSSNWLVAFSFSDFCKFLETILIRFEKKMKLFNAYLFYRFTRSYYLHINNNIMAFKKRKVAFLVLIFFPRPHSNDISIKIVCTC
jgi:hypothetical protein